MNMKNLFFKIFAFVVCFFALANSSMQAQQRTKIKDGVYLVSYGNTFVVEDDINQRSIQLRVDRKQDNSGRPVYDILCGNKLTKAIAQTALKGAIRYALVQTGVAAWVTPYATTIAGLAYDAVCEYYK
ncbi:MAG: hypothetical protein K2N13_01150 [Paraprevotella sp.]|nr:hypothetical protein [Paraprevotella sp.]